VELHLHLEGAIPLEILWELIQKYGGDPDVPTIAALVDRLHYRDFPHFITTWWWMTGYVREYDDLEHIAAAVAANLAGQNIIYAEASFSPPTSLATGSNPRRWLPQSDAA
jgi:aminodeoxyfutalosine deaminase